ncbi:UDP-glucose 4-epimerase [Murinocardiopsis flavida]|uniref:UDP-glucose 4-epimerase n=1 Tax=Murinocardiopsis flavida TaxID=645275 RepID=A0A2P8D6X1_9ACTN|nr:NAD(P)-dependent oxidoreductase [Murinocardiopsis flavida]PSK92941.1 UDP-glucose 4-epimerase [Murinocardiopsis flavida]
MRIVVTGAAGRLGRTLVQRLAADGHRTTGVDLAAPRDRAAGAEHVVLGLDDRAGLAAAFDGADAVVHLAAMMSWNPAELTDMFRVNVLGTAHVADAAATAGARLVHASSGEVYPEIKPDYQPLDEEHPRNPASLYGLTKKLDEDIVDFYRRTRGLRAVVLRFSHFQDAAELLDERGFFSGPRFFLHRRIEQQRGFGNDAMVAALLPHAVEGETRLLLSRGSDGTPFRMGILDTRDLASGVIAAIGTPEADGEAIGIGADDSVGFDALVPEMAKRTGLGYADVALPAPAVHYTTSNRKARDLLGFVPEWPIDRMLDEAVAARAARLG